MVDGRYQEHLTYNVFQDLMKSSIEDLWMVKLSNNPGGSEGPVIATAFS